MKIEYLCIVVLLIWGEWMYAQYELPYISDTFYMYSSYVDINQPLEEQINFYEADFPCLTTMAVIPSEMPRTESEFLNQEGKGITYGVDNNVLIIKGIRMGIDYLEKPTDYVQFRGGIPLINLDNPASTSESGKEELYLEYDVLDVKESLMIWSQILGYERIRLKLRIEYNTEYLNYGTLNRFDNEYYHSIQTSYTEYVEEVGVKKDGEWLSIELGTIPSEVIVFDETSTQFISYYSEGQSIPAIVKYDAPSYLIEHYMQSKVKHLPECTTESQYVYVYPNPTYNNLNVKMIGQEVGEYELSITNIVGKKLWASKFTNGEEDIFSWTLPYLPKGIYLYIIKDRYGKYVLARRLTILEH